MSEKSIPLRPNESDPPIVHRQIAVRYAPTTRANCQMLALKAGEFGPVKILDISATGVSLLTTERYEPGTFLAVELSNADGDFKRLQLVKVVHVNELGTSNYVLGGSFASKLGGDDIQALLT